MFIELLFIIIVTFVVQYFIMSWITTDTYSNITNSLNKIYLSSISSLLVAFLYILLTDFKDNTMSCNYYVRFAIAIGLLVYGYRKQYGIDEYDWFNTMIEKQSEGILLSQNMTKQKTNGSQIDLMSSELANQIVKTQQIQIDILKELKSQIKPNSIIY